MNAMTFINPYFIYNKTGKNISLKEKTHFNLKKVKLLSSFDSRLQKFGHRGDELLDVREDWRHRLMEYSSCSALLRLLSFHDAFLVLLFQLCLLYGLWIYSMVPKATLEYMSESGFTLQSHVNTVSVKATQEALQLKMPLICFHK